MSRRRLYLPALILSTIIITSLFMGGCTSSSDEIKSASEARDAAFAYLDDKYNLDAPSSGLIWQASDIASGEPMGQEVNEFISGDWNTTVCYEMAIPEEAVYEVCVSSPVNGQCWIVNVEVDGTITEIDEFEQLTEEESRSIALQFVEQSPTYLFDGIEGTLLFIRSTEVSTPYSWTFVINFDSTHAGYGDRTGRILAQVITPHTALIRVQQGEVVFASLDNKWNMISQNDLLDDIDPPVVIAGEEPDIFGIVTQIDSINSENIYGRILVELEKPNNTSDKFWITIANDTQIIQFDGVQQSTTKFDAIVQGQNVDVWFDGAVMESYPAQVSASKIVINPDLQTDDLPPIDDAPSAFNVEVSIDEFLREKHITRQIEISYPGDLVITLGSNPTTGFSWSEAANIDNDGILTQIEHRVLGYAEVEPNSSGETAIVGSGGKEVWVFSAAESGNTTLSFEYSRPWEGGEKAEWTFSLVVTVK